MIVRQGRSEDRSELFRMRQALWPDSTKVELDALLTLADSGLLVLVAERPGGGLCGFAEIGLRKFADGCDSSPVAYLEGIWVDPDLRRARIATALVRAAEEWARDLGLSELASDCEIVNHESRAFHLATGFREVQRTISFKRDLSSDLT